MKKFLSTLLAFSLVLSLTSSVKASEPLDCSMTKTVNVDGYIFDISESIDSDYVVTRTYTQTSDKAKTAFDKTATETLLCSLGIDPDLVSTFSLDELRTYASAEEITVSVAYSKRNEETGVTTPLSPEVAIAESEIINQKVEEYFLDGHISSLAAVEDPIKKIYSDSYMKVTHIIYNLGGGLYSFSTEGQWLTMPLFRGYDSIGSCASECAYDPDSGSGWYKYDTVTVKNGVASNPVSSGTLTFSKSQMKSASKDMFSGRMAYFTLPSDTYNGDIDNQVFRKNLTAYFSYQGEVSHPDNRVTFNSNGTYTHSTIRLTITPSASISFSDLVSGSGCIGFGTKLDTEKRTAEAIVHYVP